MPSSRGNYEFFLGGRDLEMVTIRQLLGPLDNVCVHDRQLFWGAKASAYEAEIARCRAKGRVAVLVELIDDLQLTDAVSAGEVLVVDHHGDLAGQDVPTALEQIFQLLQLPEDQWTREFELVAANDRGHVHGMLAVKASREELDQIRAADRAAQGISNEQESQGRAAAEACQRHAQGRLSVVHLPHNKTATVTDVLDESLGGPGYENLLIFSPAQTLFYGKGSAIERLKSRYSGGWWGGELPVRGFWGIGRALDEQDVIHLLEVIDVEETC